MPSVVEIIHELIEALIKSEQWEEAVRVCDRCVDKHCKPSGIMAYSDSLDGTGTGKNWLALFYL